MYKRQEPVLLPQSVTLHTLFVSLDFFILSTYLVLRLFLPLRSQFCLCSFKVSLLLISRFRWTLISDLSCIILDWNHLQRSRPMNQKLCTLHFAILACDVSFEHDDDKNNKVNRHQMVCSTIQRTL